MKILAFTDIHGSRKALSEIEKKIKKHKPELILCAGDLTIFEVDIENIVKKIGKLGKDVILVHGNHEDDMLTEHLCKKEGITFAHKKHIVRGDYLILGYGGDGFSIEDPEFDEVAKDFEKIIRSKENKDKKVILITHAPPHGTKLDELIEYHCGNNSIRKFIEKNKIELVVSGHIHENFNKTDEIKGTKVVNPGPNGKILAV